MTDQLVALGALRTNRLLALPDAITGGRRPGDERFEVVTARRPVMEAALARVAERTPGVEIRRGTAGRRAAPRPGGRAGVPHVAGVVTPAGEELRADLVVDAGGRRSAFPSWLAAAGGPTIPEERADAGFVYYCRHFRSGDGSVPSPIGPPLQAYDSISLLALPADHGTWGVGIISSGRDATMRAARDPETWDRVVRSYPLIAPWLEGEPITGVDVMAGIPDVRRSYWPDGVPLVTGAVAVGDAWAATNPSLGRGASIGLRHAVALRHVLRCAPGADPFDLARCWMEVTEGTVGHLVAGDPHLRQASPGRDRRPARRPALRDRRPELEPRPVDARRGRTRPGPPAGGDGRRQPPGARGGRHRRPSGAGQGPGRRARPDPVPRALPRGAAGPPHPDRSGPPGVGRTVAAVRVDPSWEAVRAPWRVRR